MRQKSVKFASKMRQKYVEHLWGRTPFGRYRYEGEALASLGGYFHPLHLIGAAFAIGHTSPLDWLTLLATWIACGCLHYEKTLEIREITEPIEMAKTSLFPC